MNGISLIRIGSFIWRLITTGEQAFNLEIKKKSGSSIDLDIHQQEQATRAAKKMGILRDNQFLETDRERKRKEKKNRLRRKLKVSTLDF